MNAVHYGTSLPFAHLEVEERKTAMTDIHEKDLADQIDRDIDSRQGLLALLVCLSVTVGLALAGVADLVGAI